MSVIACLILAYIELLLDDFVVRAYFVCHLGVPQPCCRGAITSQLHHIAAKAACACKISFCATRLFDFDQITSASDINIQLEAVLLSWHASMQCECLQAMALHASRTCSRAAAVRCVLMCAARSSSKRASAAVTSSCRAAKIRPSLTCTALAVL